MSEPTQEMLDAWAKIPKPKDRPYCRVCHSTDVTLFTVQTTTHRWEDTGILSARWVRNMGRGPSTESMGCNECKTLDLPIQTRFSLEHDE